MSVVEQRLSDGVLTIVLNRPEKLNALNASVLHALSGVLREAKDRSEVRGLLLTGQGKAFCAGADISQFAECDAQSGYHLATYGQEVFRQLETLGKPSIAVVQGYAFGGGCELALAATLRIAARTAQFGQPEVKLGIMPGYGGTQRLARLVGKGRALDLCLSGRFIDASTALQWGLVNEIAEPDDLLDVALERLQAILAVAPLAVASVMEVIDRGFDLNLDDALRLEALHFAKLCASEDKAEGVSAYLEKRAPDFKGL